MDRLYWSSVSLYDHEDFVHTVSSIKLYDGDEKRAHYEDGTLILTSHRLIWSDSNDDSICLALDHSYIVHVDEEAPTFTKSGKVVCHLLAPQPGSKRGAVSRSVYNHVRWSFSKGGHTEFMRRLKDTLGRRLWEQSASTRQAPGAPYKVTQLKTGIAGIEKRLQEQQKKTESTITEAFNDLNVLMAKAKEMVDLSKSISSKIEQRQGNISEDETIKFKSYLLSLGIPDPVTRDSHKSNTKYLQELSKQISSVLHEPLKDSGGVMTLSDAYCRVNRARGIEDLLDACRLLPNLDLPVTLKEYESGVVVLQLRSNNEDKAAEEALNIVKENTCISPDEFANIVGLSVILAKERLLLAEQKGKICRDDTVEGLRFYPNRFLTEQT